jgi:outer membrane protein TolC
VKPFALLACLAVSVGPITLEQVREESRKATPAQLSALDVARAERQVDAARSVVYPQVSLRAGAGAFASGPQRLFTTVPSRDESGGVGFQQAVVEVPSNTRASFELSVQASQLVYDGGRWGGQVAQAAAQAEAARGQLDEQRLATELEGVRRFFDLYRSQRTMDVLLALEKRSADQVELAALLFEAARLPKSEVFSARVNAGNDRVQVLRHRSRIAAAQSDLAAYLSREQRSDLVAVEPLPPAEAPLPFLVEALATAKGRRPFLRALQRQVRAAELMIEVARAGARPRVAAQLTLGRQSPNAIPFFTDPIRQNYLSAGVSLQWDLFNGYLTDSQVQQAEVARTTATTHLEQAERDLSADLNKALALAESQRAVREVALANLALATEGAKLAEDRFRAGSGHTLEVRDAQLKVAQAELSVLESGVEVALSREALSRVMGSRTGAREVSP